MLACLAIIQAVTLLQAFGAQLAISCGLAVAGSLAVQLGAPLAAGGGVPMVRA